MMGTNSTGCTEWERDYDPITEQPMSDEQRWGMVAIGGSIIRRLAKLAIKAKVPKHVVIELFSEAYDEARDDARSSL